jgi:hypothetical protein
MTRIRTRNPAGGEYSFTREEFVRAVERHGITADWQVYHAASGRWLPVTAHPAFPLGSGRGSGSQERRSSSELILIYPDPDQRSDSTGPASTNQGEDDGPVLAPDEIDRVLGRSSGPQGQPRAPGDRGWSTAVRRVSGPVPGDLEDPAPEAFAANMPLLERLLIMGIVILLIVAAISAAEPVKPRPPSPPPPPGGQPPLATH